MYRIPSWAYGGPFHGLNLPLAATCANYRNASRAAPVARPDAVHATSQGWEKGWEKVTATKFGKTERFW